MQHEDVREVSETDAHEDTLFYSARAHHDGRTCAYHSRLGIWIAVTASFQEGRALECTRTHHKIS